MPLPGDVRKQVLVQVRTDGEGLAEKLAVELANATARMVSLQNQIASGNTTVQESQRDWKNLSTEISFLSKELKQASDALARSSDDYEEYQQKLRVLAQDSVNAAAATEEKSRREVAAGLNAVQARIAQIRELESAEKARAAAAVKAAEAKEAADLREAERLAKFVADYEADQAKKDAAAEKAALKEAERQAKFVADYIRDQAKRDEASERAELKEAERLAKLVADYEADQARRDAAAEKAAIKEAERQAKLVDDYIRDQAKKDEAAEHAAIKEAERQAKLVADYEADEARKQQARDQTNVAAANWVLNNSLAQGTEALQQNRKQVEELRRAHEASILSTHSVISAQNQFGRSSEEGSEAAKRFSYGLLNIAHAAQDAQYGFGAVLNNIPLVVQALGGGGAAAGGLMIAGTALATMGPSLHEFNVQLGLARDASEWTGRTVGELREKIAALESKRSKVSIDYSEIEIARKKLEELQDAESAYAAGKMSPEERFQKERGEEAVKVVSTKEIATKMRNADEAAGVDRASPETTEALNFASKYHGSVQKRFDEADPVAKLLIQPILAHAAGKLAELEAKANEQRESYYKEIAGGFALGKPGNVNQVREFDQLHPGLFTSQQRTAIQSVPYTPEMVKELTPQFSDRARREEQNYIREQTEKNREKARLDEQLRQQGARQQVEAQEKVQRERDHEVRTTSSAVETESEKLFMRRATQLKAGGASDEDIRKGLTGDARKHLEAIGIGSDIADKGKRDKFIDDTMREVLDKFMTDFRAKMITRALGLSAAGSPATPKDAAASFQDEYTGKDVANQDKAERGVAASARRAGTQAKRFNRQQIAAGMQQEYGLTDEQAQDIAPHVAANMKKGMSPQAAGQAAMARLRHYIEQQQKVILEGQANMEQMFGILGPATAMLGQMRANNARMAGMINQAGRGANGGGMFPGFPPR